MESNDLGAQVEIIIFFDNYFDLFRSIFTKGVDVDFDSAKCRQWLYEEARTSGQLSLFDGVTAQAKSVSFFKWYRERLKIWKRQEKVVPHSKLKNQWILRGYNVSM